MFFVLPHGVIFILNLALRGWVPLGSGEAPICGSHWTVFNSYFVFHLTATSWCADVVSSWTFCHGCLHFALNLFMSISFA